MPAREQFERILQNLGNLGARRLILLAIIGVTVFAAVGLTGMYLSRPSKETLYAGLETQDVTRIGAALNAAGIEYDISPDGKAVLVAVGHTARARMLLAEKGLPRSASAGYELFDELGSLGLTSFMQEVTRVRALEGEIARTIQLMQGVKAARVHLVMPDPGSFRASRQLPSASVVIRTALGDSFGSARAIRHLVAAAIPRLRVDRVTVLNTEGALLAAGDDAMSGAPRKMADLEKSINNEIQEKIQRTLTPFLGLGNFQSSVTARLNVDQRKIQEVVYDPESRVERSVRVVKEGSTANNKSKQSDVSVEEEIPGDDGQPGGGDQSTESSERREELTNYEVNSKTVSTEKKGYHIENLAIALVINRKRIDQLMGDNASTEKSEGYLDEIRQLVASAAGISDSRGDTLKVTAIDFVETSSLLAPVDGPGLLDRLLPHSGTLISALAIVVATFVLVWFGLRPATRILVAPSLPAPREVPSLQGLPEGGTAAGSAADRAGATSDTSQTSDQLGQRPNLVQDLTNRVSQSPQKRLQQIVELDEEQAVMIMKRWSRTAA